MKLVYYFDNFQGFGDNIRGLISILQIKKRLNFNLVVDFSKHIFRKYFVHNSINRNVQIKKLYMYGDEIQRNDFITNEIKEMFKIYKSIGIYTNTFPIIGEIDNDIKTYIKNLFILKPEVEEYIQNLLATLPENFNLFHYRLGDNILINNANINYTIYLKHFFKNIKENSVLISDSLEFKKKIFDICKNNGVYVFLNKPHHTNTNKTDIYTLIDFFLIRNAKSVNCYSCYNWISNFVLWSSIIYDVPLFNIK